MVVTALLVAGLLTGCGWRDRFGLPREIDAREVRFVNWALTEVQAREPDADLVELEAHRHVLFVTLRRPAGDVRYRAEPQLPVVLEGPVGRRADLLPFVPGLVPRQMIEKLPNEYIKHVRCHRSTSQVTVTGTYSGVAWLRVTCEGYRDAPALNAIGGTLVEPVGDLAGELPGLLHQLAALTPASGTGELVIATDPATGDCSLTTRFIAEVEDESGRPGEQVVWRQRRCADSDDLLAGGFGESADAAALAAGRFRLTDLDPVLLGDLLRGQPPRVSATQLRVAWSPGLAAPVIEVTRAGLQERYTGTGQPI